VIKDVDIYEPFTYDGFITFELYLNYLESVADIEYFVRYVKRLVIMRILEKYYHLGDICEDLVQSSLMEIWRMADKEKLPQDKADSFHEFIHTIITRHVARAFHIVYDDAPKLLEPEHFEKNYLHRFKYQFDVEANILLDEMPESLTKSILKHVRFEDAGSKDSVAYILDRIFSGNRVVFPWMRRRWGVDNCKFLMEHVLILLRNELYEIKKTISWKKIDENLLNEVYGEDD